MNLHIFFVAVLQLLFFLPISLRRIVGGDEGFYLIAAKEVAHGALPYVDFFYPQMPLLPLVYGVWMDLVGASWSSARVFSAGLTAMVGVVLFIRLALLFSKRWAYVGVLLFATSQFVFPWYVIAKTYALSTLLLFGAYVVFAHACNCLSAYAFCAAGLLLGLAVNTRLFFCAVIVVFVLEVLRLPRKQRWTAVLYFSLGIGVTTLALIYFMMVAFESFWFSNVGYHVLRSNLLWFESLKQKMTILRTILGMRETQKFSGVQFPLTLVAGAFSYIGMLYRKSRADMALSIAVALAAVSLVPTPSYVQYFCVLVPFLIVGIVWLLQVVVAARVLSPYAVSVLCLVFSYYYFLPVPSDINKYTGTGRGVLTILGPRDAKTLDAMGKVAAAINDVTDPGERVLTTWPGLLVDSHARPYRGLENHFGLKKGHKVPSEQRGKLHVISQNDLWNILVEGRARTVVLDRRLVRKQYSQALSMYDVVRTTEYYAVLQRS